jgi:hypothetical protein
MKLKSALLFILLFAVSAAYSQKFFPGKLIFFNGETRDGLVKIKSSNWKKFVYYKAGVQSDEQKIKSETVKFVYVFSDQGDTSILENVQFDKKFKRFVDRVIQGYATLYYCGDGMHLDKHGVIIHTSTYVVGRSQPVFYYDIQRKGERFATSLALVSPSKTMFGQDKNFRKSAAEYFKDYPELVKRIEDKEFTVDDIVKVVLLYNEHMEGK